MVVLAAGIAGGVLYWLHARHYVSTNDAFIDTHIVHVAPRIGGQVLAVQVQDNQQVEQGQPLFDIDPKMVQAELDHARAARQEADARLAEAKAQVVIAEANAAQAQAQVAVARANADNADRNYQRLLRLGTLSSSSNLAVTRQQLDDAQARQRSTAATLAAAQKRADAAKAQIADAESSVRVAQAVLAGAQAQLVEASLQRSYTQVTAPMAGRVTKLDLAPGDHVDAGVTVLALVPRKVWVTANFKETELAHIRPGQPVTISVDAYPSRVFRGTVNSVQAGTGSVFSLLPPQNATGNYVKIVQRVPVKITFDHLPDNLLLAPGMSVVPQIKVR